MNMKASFLFAPERRYAIIATCMPRGFRGIVAKLADIRRRRRARRAFRRWSTPEAQWAYASGMNRGAMLGILWCSFIGVLLLAGLWLAGAGM